MISLRLRLTSLYATILGGAILIIGVVVYSAVNIAITSQVDDILAQAVKDTLPVFRVDTQGRLEIINLRSINLTENLLIQVWVRQGQQLAASENARQFTQSLDPVGLQYSYPIYRQVMLNQIPLRVLSVPLVVNQRQEGILQVAINIKYLDNTRSVLLGVMGGTALVAMIISGIIAWLVIGRALAPLELVTDVATQITRADDLSRRIPFTGPTGDEVSLLIEAFNQTLSRLETLFTAQRRFLADVSHELRTPLTVIKGNVGLMRRMHELDEDALQSVDLEVDRLTRMVSDLLLLAQAETGKIPLDLKPVDLDTVVLEVFQQMKVLAGDRVQVKISEIDQVQVTGDRDRLKQVLLNLGGNAVKYTPRGGVVRLGVAKTNNQARIIFSDNGPGIRSDDLPHIFERFYRSEKSRQRGRDENSYGLGLSIAYWIVRNHGGRIEVDSKEGVGSTFCVWLPFEGPPAT